MNRQLQSQLLRPAKTEVDAKRRRPVGSGINADAASLVEPACHRPASRNMRAHGRIAPDKLVARRRSQSIHFGLRD
jgi:hypothetical protein